MKYKLHDRKMKPYIGEGKWQGKYKSIPFHEDFDEKVTKNSKLIAKNANRSLKKAERQKAKKEINESLN